MYKTKIDWCDSSWNPVTGCLHDCEYCYARRIANRFAGAQTFVSENVYVDSERTTIQIHDLWYGAAKKENGKAAPYPFGFEPTFHQYRLEVPKRWTEPRTIFVCSMADLFGEWVPDEWIEDVLRAAKEAPQHRYLFLTKNPGRYARLPAEWFDGLDAWIGTTVCRNDDVQEKGRILDLSDTWNKRVKWFVSVEPLLEEMNLGSLDQIGCMDWVIVGAESGSRSGKIKPRKEWIAEIAETCAECCVPIFMKQSVKEIMGEGFRQEFPWKRGDGNG